MKRPLISISIASIVIVLALSAIAIWKYQTFQYDALDLAIYSQVAWNIYEGNGFMSAIQQQSYFGDHIEPFVAIVAISIQLFRSPLALPILQILILISASIPLFLLAKKILNEKIAILVAGAFLINPVVWNMALFEFHMLTVAIPVLLWMLYLYQKKQFLAFALLGIFAVLIREDVGIAVFGFGLLALVDKRRLMWWLAPMLTGGLWFAVAMSISNTIRPEGYKFFAYYGWLGASFPDMLQRVFTDPLYVLANIFSFGNILFCVALALLFLGLPVFGWRGLIPSIGIFAQLLLGQFNPQLLLDTHYAAPLLPFLFYASIKGLQRLDRSQSAIIKKIKGELRIPALCVASALLCYTFFFLGPVVPGIRDISSYDTSTAQDLRDLLSHIPPDAPVVSSYRTLPNLSLRENIFSLHYAALGKKQFSGETYALDPHPTYAVIDLSDFTFFEYQYATLPSTKDDYPTMHERLRNILAPFALEQASESFLLVREKKENEQSIVDVLIETTAPEHAFAQTITDEPSISCIGASLRAPGEYFAHELVIDYIVLAQPKDATKGYALQIGNNEQLAFPMGWNLFPLHATPPGTTVRMRIPLPRSIDVTGRQTFKLIEREGFAVLHGFNTAKPTTTSSRVIAEFTFVL